MSRLATLSAAALADLARQDNEEVWLLLVEIDHADLAAPLRYVNHVSDVVSNGDTYTAMAFNVRLPDDVGDEMPDVLFEIDAVDQSILTALRPLGSAPTVDVNLILLSAPNTIQVGPLGFTLTEMSYDAQTITGRLVYEEILDEPIPAHRYSPENFPALFA